MNYELRHDPERQGNIITQPLWAIPFNEFQTFYNQLMTAVKEKEKKGRLDPRAQPYEPVSEAEKAVLETDWKQFSRRRGFNDQDIAEYEQWLLISGQLDNLPGAINDPWRRERPDWDKRLYILHIQRALDAGELVPAGVLQEFTAMKEDMETPRNPLTGKRWSTVREPLVCSSGEAPSTTAEDDVW